MAQHGTFGWADLASPDQQGSERFYQGLFGWEVRHEPIDENAHYTMFHRNGQSIAGLGEAQEGQPPVWSTYVSVDDVDAVAGKASELGASVIVGPMDVMEQGRMAVIADPAGAVLGLWQPGTHVGADLFRQPGTLSWFELATRDREAARRFYGELLGWTFDEMDMGDQGTYLVARIPDEEGVAGILEMTEQWPADIPPHWAIYIEVEDVDATVGRAGELGGNVLVEPTNFPGGRFALIQDPYGATFYVVNSAAMQA